MQIRFGRCDTTPDGVALSQRDGRRTDSSMLQSYLREGFGRCDSTADG